MALIRVSGLSLFTSEILSESALTRLWLDAGYAELAEVEQREPWRNRTVRDGFPPALPPPTAPRGPGHDAELTRSRGSRSFRS
jgi:hypothetical protein